MKKWIIMLFAMMLSIGTVEVASAKDTNYFNESENKIFDRADLFSDTEEEELRQLVKDTSKKYEMDVIIVTIDKNNKSNARKYADSFYDDNKFGYEAAYGTGVLLLIDMDTREVYISTSGLARVYLDEYIEDILDEVQPLLTEKKYYNAALSFNNEISEYAAKALKDKENDKAIEAWNNIDKYDTKNIEKFYKDVDLETNLFSGLKNPLVSGIIAIAIGGIAVLIMSFSAKTKNTVNSKTYLEGGSFKLSSRQDRYTHTTTTKRKIETNSGSSGGGGGSHSHGGGGRSF